MIIDNLDIRWSRLMVVPFEANPPLIVYANAVLPLPISGQRLKAIPWQREEVSQRGRGFQTIELNSGRAFDAGKRLDPVPEGERSCALVSIAENQVSRIAHTRYYEVEVPAVNVSLSPELEKLVQAKVESGLYGSASEVVEDALRLLERQEIHLQELRARMDEGLASLDRGEGVDGEEFMQKMLDELDAQEAQRKAG
jgi:antitoxin ParD1/3/4